MLSHHLLSLYRSLVRHRLYSVLNVAGLAFGIATFLVLFLFVSFETGFERWIPHADRIYLVRGTLRLPGLPASTNNITAGGLLDELRADYPNLLGTRLSNQWVAVRRGAEGVEDRLALVDPTFLRVFDLPVVAGDPAAALSDPAGLILTQATARTYFGSASPLGRTLTITVLGAPRAYRVRAVIKDLPPDTDLRIGMLARLVPGWFQAEFHNFNQWGFGQLETFLVFPNPAQAGALAAEFDGFTDRRAARDLDAPPLKPHQIYHLSLAPLTSVHLIERKDAVVVAAMAVVAALTLLIAAVNYVNLASARAAFRAREVALRKVMGATRASLIVQFIGESVAVSALAALVGLALVELALPLVDASSGLPLKLPYLGADGALAVLGFVAVAVGVGAGLYPAFVLSAFRPATVLASARMPGGGRGGARLRQALVALQFAIAIGFTAATAVLFAQAQYVRRADLGFQRDGLILAPGFQDGQLTDAQRQALLDGFRGLPGVVDVAQSNSAPGGGGFSLAEGMRRPGQTGAPTAVGLVQIGPGFFTTYGARLIAGRWLDPSYRSDDTAGRSPDQLAVDGENIVIDAQAVRSLGFASPRASIGGRIFQDRGARARAIPITVVGVVQDMRFLSPRQRPSPTAYVLSSRDIVLPVAAVRYARADPRLAEQGMRRVWRTVAPEVPFQARTVRQTLSQFFYRPDEQRMSFLAMGAAVAVLIGCVGLYGLASFSVASRTREVGIRKTLGASGFDILRLMARQFLGPVLLASLLAWPAAWWAMRGWLAGFDQRIALGPGYFLAATTLALAIAALTVAGHAVRIARAAPGAALRYE